MGQSPTQLEYEVLPGRVRRNYTRHIGFIVVFLVTAVFAWQWGPGMYSRVALRIAEQKARQYIAPADHVIFDDDPKRMAMLLASSRQYVSVGVGVGVGDVPLAWSHYFDQMTPPGRRVRGGIAFLHERCSRSGVRRVISVEAVSQLSPQAGFFRDIEWHVCMMPLAEDRPLVALPESTWMPRFATQSILVFAGQPDPNDASHFTIHVKTDRSSIIYDGWLRNDGNHIDLEMRK